MNARNKHFNHTTFGIAHKKDASQNKRCAVIPIRISLRSKIASKSFHIWAGSSDTIELSAPTLGRACNK